MQCPQFGTRGGAQRLVEGEAGRLVRRQRLGPAARRRQRAEVQGPQRLVQGRHRDQGGQFRQGVLGAAERGVGGEAGAARLGVAALGPYDQRVPFPYRKVGQDRPLPQCEGLVEQPCRLPRVAVRQRVRAFPGQPFEAEHVDVVGGGGQPVAARRGPHGVPAERPPQPSDQRLHGRGLVGGGGAVVAPDAGGQFRYRHRASGARGEGGEQGPQPGTAEGHLAAVRAQGPRRSEYAVAECHPPIVHGGRDGRLPISSRRGPVPCGRRSDGLGAG